MISKIYGSNKIMFAIGSRKGKTKEQIALMVERVKDREYKNFKKQRDLIKKVNEQIKRGIIK